MSETPNRYTETYHKITVEANLIEPALVAAAFDLLRLQARAAGLEDVGLIRINLSVDFAGRTTQANVDELGDRLEALWLADITKHEAKPPRATSEGDEAA